MTETQEIVVVLTSLSGKFDSLSAVLSDFVQETRETNHDHESRLRTLEGVIHAIDKISSIEGRLCKIEESIITINNREHLRRGMERAISVGLGIVGGFVSALMAIAGFLYRGGGS